MVGRPYALPQPPTQLVNPFADPALDKSELMFKTREERLAFGWKIMGHVHSRLEDLGYSDSFMQRRFYNREVGIATGADLHDSMFLMTLTGQGDDEQKEQWVPLARSKAIIGESRV